MKGQWNQRTWILLAIALSIGSIYTSFRGDQLNLDPFDRWAVTTICAVLAVGSILAAMVDDPK